MTTIHHGSKLHAGVLYYKGAKLRTKVRDMKKKKEKYINGAISSVKGSIFFSLFFILSKVQI
jgi:hypothetical protein